MVRRCVIGIGNPLRGDDGVGVRLVRELEAHAPQIALEIIACHQLTPELADTLSRVSQVVFVDADVSSEPGEVSCRMIEPRAAHEAFSHRLEPSELLALTELLYGHCPKAHLLSIGAHDVALNEQLSTEVECAVPVALARLLQLTGASEQPAGRLPVACAPS